jgi:hypothetical protein
MTSKSFPLRHAELLQRAAMEAPTATKTLAAIAIPPTTADTSTTAPLPATAKGPAAVEPPVAAVARALRYNDLRAIYRRYTAVREAWYKA